MPGIKFRDLSIRQEVLKLPILLPKYFLEYFPDHVENLAKLYSSFILLVPPGAFLLVSVWKHLHKMSTVAQSDQAAAASCTGSWMLHLVLLQAMEGLSKRGVAGPCSWAGKQLCASALQSFALVFPALGGLYAEKALALDGLLCFCKTSKFSESQSSAPNQPFWCI